MSSKGVGLSKAAAAGELSDEQLVFSYLAGGRRDDRLFAELFRRHRRAVWRRCYAFFDNALDAEDLTQEVFFTVYRKLPQFRGEASLRTWLERVATNTCKNELRRRSRRPRTLDGPVEVVARYRPSEAPGPAAVTEARRAGERLVAAFAALSEPERRLLQDADVDKKPYKEIAADLGISLSAAKMRVLRTRLAFKQAYSRLAEPAERNPDD